MQGGLSLPAQLTTRRAPETAGCTNQIGIRWVAHVLHFGERCTHFEAKKKATRNAKHQRPKCIHGNAP
eukprot:scaffold237069_cov19-Tisochrysis_lutea.AAC.1